MGYEGMFHGGIIASIIDDLTARTLRYTGLDIVIAHLELDYKTPVHVEEWIKREAQMTGFGTGRSIRAQGTIKQEGAVAARAKGIMVIARTSGQGV